MRKTHGHGTTITCHYSIYVDVDRYRGDDIQCTEPLKNERLIINAKPSSNLSTEWFDWIRVSFSEDRIGIAKIYMIVSILSSHTSIPSEDNTYMLCQFLRSYEEDMKEYELMPNFKTDSFEKSY